MEIITSSVAAVSKRRDIDIWYYYKEIKLSALNVATNKMYRAHVKISGFLERRAANWMNYTHQTDLHLTHLTVPGHISIDSRHLFVPLCVQLLVNNIWSHLICCFFSCFPLWNLVTASNKNYWPEQFKLCYFLLTKATLTVRGAIQTFRFCSEI